MTAPVVTLNLEPCQGQVTTSPWSVPSSSSDELSLSRLSWTRPSSPRSGSPVISSYGVYVLLEHPDGYETMYGHLSRVLVARGERVREGQVIALSGNSGRSTAPHLHFEVRRRGRSVDPLTLVREGN